MKDDRDAVSFQSGVQPECFGRCRVEVLIVRAELDAFATQIADTAVIFGLPVRI